MGSIYLGNFYPDRIYLGSNQVDKLYYGIEQIYPSVIPPVNDGFTFNGSVKLNDYLPVSCRVDEIITVKYGDEFEQVWNTIGQIKCDRAYTGNITITTNMSDMKILAFNYSGNSTIINQLISWGQTPLSLVSSVYNGLFRRQKNLISIADDIYGVTSTIQDWRLFCEGCVNLTTVGKLYFDGATNAQELFNGCTKLTTVHTLDCSNLTYMGMAFQNCSALTRLELTNTQNVYSASSLVTGCPQLNYFNEFDFSSCTQNFIANDTFISTTQDFYFKNLGILLDGIDCRYITKWTVDSFNYTVDNMPNRNINIILSTAINNAEHLEGITKLIDKGYTIIWR